nr:amidohydrolase [uncultured Agathobaculum sp.]
MKTLYYGGTIRTLEETDTQQALLVENGVIAATGELESMQARARDAAMIDLEGRALLPGFIDAHSHFSGAAYALLQAPLDEAACFADIVDALTQFIAQRHVPVGQWVVGRGYDQNALAEGRHPDRTLLDRVSAGHPIMVVHQSGHMGVFNTVALERLGVAYDTAAPAGGSIARSGGQLTGYMEENAFVHYQQQVPAPDMDDLLDACRCAQQMYASYGVTTVQEGMLTEGLIPLYEALQAHRVLELDIVAYPGVDALEAACTAFPDAVRRYVGHFKIGGCKLFLDGSPQGRTAWMRTPYQGASDGYRGCGTMTDSALEDALMDACHAGMQPLVHCNGDAAAAQLLSVAAAIEQTYPDLRALRPVMVHAQLLDVDQMDEVKRLGILPSFFVAHVYRWGDTHIKNFGLARASRISAAKAALDRGIRFTLHQDTPVLPPDMLNTIWCAANRVTRSGVTLGAEQRIPVEAALRAVTENAAYQYFEETRLGTLHPGKAADFVLLDADPFSVPLDKLRGIRVLETIKAGETVWRA